MLVRTVFSRIPQPGIVTAESLCFYFLTDDGLQQIGYPSPGSAWRNHTLGGKALDTIQVPVPPYIAQIWFDRFYDKAKELRKRQETVEKELAALLPSILSKAFRGELEAHSLRLAMKEG